MCHRILNTLDCVTSGERRKSATSAAVTIGISKCNEYTPFGEISIHDVQKYCTTRNFRDCDALKLVIALMRTSCVDNYHGIQNST